jgi:hypothetical protein
MRALLFLSCLALAACGSPASEDVADSDDALTSSPSYFVLARTTKSGDVYVAPANGGTLRCPSGSLSQSCLVTPDFSTVEASAKATFLAGNAIVEAAPLARGNKALVVKRAWASIGARVPAASGEKTWLVTPGAAFHDRELDSTYARNATALAFDARMTLAAGDESRAREAVSTGGILVRGVHAYGVMRATAAYVPIVAAAPAADLTSAQKATLLHTVDNLCGDTWCSGDYNFSFDAMTCDLAAGTCKMDLHVIYPNDGSPDAKTIAHSCAFANYHAYDALITTFSPVYSQLTAPFKTDMDGCIDGAEAAFPH